MTVIPRTWLDCFSFFRQRKLNRELLDAVDKGLTDQVRHMLDQGADVNASDGYDSALCRAGRSAFSNTATVQLLLERGASLRPVPPGRGCDPLIRASHWSDDERICLLIRAGANVKATHRYYGFSPLRELVSWASLDTIKLLLDHGAEINHQGCADNCGTALHVAAISRSLKVVKVLIARGADPGIKNRVGQTVLAWTKSHLNTNGRLPTLTKTIAYLEGLDSAR